MPAVHRLDYQRITDEIRQRIESGELKPGDKLPTKRQLCAFYAIGSLTVDNAMIVLKTAGLVEGRQGKSVYVK